MVVEEAVIARVLSLSAVTTITGTRWWLIRLPQRPVYPAGRVTLIDEVVPFHLRGPVGTNAARIQVDLYVDEATAAAAGVNPYAQISALSEAVQGNGLGPQATGLLGWKGTIGSPAFRVLGVFRSAELGIRYDPDELKVLTKTHEYVVHWKP